MNSSNEVVRVIDLISMDGQFSTEADGSIVSLDVRSQIAKDGEGVINSFQG